MYQKARTGPATSPPLRAAAGTAVAAIALALTLGASAMAWRLLTTIEWTLWSPGDATVTALAVAGSLLGGRFVLEVIAASVQAARGRGAPRWSGRLARSVAAGLLALIAGAGAATAADQTPSAGWLPADETPPPVAPVATLAPTPTPVTTPAPAAPLDPSIVPADGFVTPFGAGAPDLLRPASPAPPADAPAPADAPRDAGPDSAEAPAPATYRVARGDSLWRITARLLGETADDAAIATAWPELYHQNRAVIGEDPGLILVGQVLTLPASLAGGAR